MNAIVVKAKIKLQAAERRTYDKEVTTTLNWRQDAVSCLVLRDVEDIGLMGIMHPDVEV